jgi:ribosomal protein S18 acetylase RimI-like enzyme
MNHQLDSATAAQLLAHLQACDAAFVPPLSQRVDLPAYADKLGAKARRVEAWQGDQLAGLIAMYANADTGTGFITNVSVLPARQGRGLAGELLQRTLVLARDLGLNKVALEVHRDNTPALKLYRQHGFLELPGRAQPPHLYLNLDLPSRDAP